MKYEKNCIRGSSRHTSLFKYDATNPSKLNVDGTNAADVNAWILRSAVAYNIASTVSVPADATLILVSRDTTIYLMEGDVFQMSASASGDLEVVASYEEIS